jgi:hypothetical protein
MKERESASAYHLLFIPIIAGETRDVTQVQPLPVELWTMLSFAARGTLDGRLTFTVCLISSFRWPRDRYLLVQMDWGLPWRRAS